jgi:hypothetical protein
MHRRFRYLIIIIICIPFALSISGCQPGESLTPEETIWAFWRAAMENDPDTAVSYWEGDNSFAASLAPEIIQLEDDKLEEFYSLCLCELLEEGDEYATVRWTFDILTMLGEEGLEAVMYAGKEGKGFRPDKVGDMQRELAEKRALEESTMDFTLEKIKGRWMITGYDYPLK